MNFYMLPGWLYEYSSTFKGWLKGLVGLSPMTILCVHRDIQVMGPMCHSLSIQQRFVAMMDPIYPVIGTALFKFWELVFQLGASQGKSLELTSSHLPDIPRVACQSAWATIRTARGKILKTVNAHLGILKVLHLIRVQ